MSRVVASLAARLWILVATTVLPVRMAHRLAMALGRRRIFTGTPSRPQLGATIAARLGVGPSDASTLAGQVLERRALEQLEGGMLRFKAKSRIARLIEIRGLDHVDAALARGRGCILYSGHFRGRWTFLAALGLLGYAPMFVRQNPPASMGRLLLWFQARFDRMFASRFACGFLFTEGPGPSAAAAAVAHLKGNGVLVNLIDISTYAARVVEVDFLNRKEPFPVGNARLERLTGAPLLSFSIRYSPERAVYVAEIVPPAESSGDQLARTQALARRIEAAIVHHPQDWAGWDKSQYSSDG